MSKAIPVSLRLAAAVAKSSFEDIPDQDPVWINIRLPWKTADELDKVQLFPADTYQTFMQRLSIKFSDDHPLKMLQGGLTLKIESEIKTLKEGK